MSPIEYRSRTLRQEAGHCQIIVLLRDATFARGYFLEPKSGCVFHENSIGVFYDIHVQRYDTSTLYLENFFPRSLQKIQDKSHPALKCHRTIKNLLLRCLIHFVPDATLENVRTFLLIAIYEQYRKVKILERPQTITHHKPAVRRCVKTVLCPVLGNWESHRWEDRDPNPGTGT